MIEAVRVKDFNPSGFLYNENHQQMDCNKRKRQVKSHRAQDSKELRTETAFLERY